MTPDRSTRVQDAFLHACDLQPDRAREYAASIFADDPELQRQLLSLLDHDLACAEFEAKPDPDDLAHDFPAGARIGSFRLFGLLGEGGMGVVYEAEDAVGRRVALKLVRSAIPTSDDSQRFEREIRTLASLEHPGIARFYEAVEWNEGRRRHRAFSMQLVRGKPMLEGAGALSINARLNLLAQVADALHYAHGRGVIHRDLKPSNILVTAEGQPAILDFGVAKLTSTEDHGATLAGAVVGTPEFMAPELFESRPATPSSDVYSLGLLGFMLMTGQMPYPVEARSISSVAHVVTQVTPLRAGLIRRELSGDIETILGKCLEKDPARRYLSAADFAGDIRRYISREPILARPPSTAYLLAVFARRNKVLVGGVLATLGALILGLAASLWALGLAKQAEAAAEIARKEFARIAQANEKARWEIFETPALMLENIQVDRLQEILNDRSTAHNARDVVDEVVVTPSVAGTWDAPELYEPYAAQANAAANFYRDVKKYDQAETLLKRVLTIRLRQFGPDHPDVAVSNSNLAYLYNNFLRRPADAEPLLVEALRVFRLQTDPRWQSDLAGTMDTLARTWLDLGRGDDAERLYREALAMREPVSNSDVNYAKSLHNLGRCIDERGRHAEALPLLQRSLRIFQSQSEPSLAAIASTSLGCCHLNLGDIQSAESSLTAGAVLLDSAKAPARVQERLYRGLIRLHQIKHERALAPATAWASAGWRQKYAEWKNSAGAP